MSMTNRDFLEAKINLLKQFQDIEYKLSQKKSNKKVQKLVNKCRQGKAELLDSQLEFL